MHKSLVLTILGSDKPGLVNAVSNTLKDFQGNWEESRMVELSGQFAGLLKVTLPVSAVPEFKAALQTLRTQGLQVTMADAVIEDEVSGKLVEMEVLGQDAPGIIQSITAKLAQLGVNIHELCSEQRQAPMSAEKLFFATLSLELPAGIDEEQVQDGLEELAEQLLVDINFSKELAA